MVKCFFLFILLFFDNLFSDDNKPAKKMAKIRLGSFWILLIDLFAQMSDDKMKEDL